MSATPHPQRSLPSVERLIESAGPTAVPRPLVAGHARAHLARARQRVAGPGPSSPPGMDSAPNTETVIGEFRESLLELERSRLGPVINATGILIHTNLGRSPLSSAAVDAVTAVARGYSNLEIDLESGERGPRAGYLKAALAALFQADDAMVVNNCAAALVLALRHFTRGTRKDVVISRGELVQIGGGFRIPDILESSGARLREVGTTNHTALADYRSALGPDTALLLSVHRSNFFMEGFVSSPDPTELGELAREQGIPFVVDLGSGAAVELDEFNGPSREPLPGDALRRGADLVCFSGDKLLGGPQAGIVVGRTDLVRALEHDPFFRALRCDKLVFAALQATVESYLHAAARRDHGPPVDIPILAALRASVADLRRRAERILAELARPSACACAAAAISIVESVSRIGGGVCPRSHLASVALRIESGNIRSADQLARQLRLRDVPILGCVHRDAVQLDLRTVRPEEDDAVILALRSI